MSDLCLYCGSRLYYLNDGMVKCTACRKKYSPAKAQRDIEVIRLFCQNLTAIQCSKQTALSYVTVKRRYDTLRTLLTAFLETAYEKERENVKEYDEYFYLEASKRGKKRYIFDAHNFLTFDYGGKVYTILMPSLHRHKQVLYDEGLEEMFYKEFSKFIRLHRIAKLEKSKNTITAFWEFFELFMKPYKGIRSENFGHYLKEAEFKFNYPSDEQEKILHALWFR